MRFHQLRGRCLNQNVWPYLLKCESTQRHVIELNYQSLDSPVDGFRLGHLRYSVLISSDSDLQIYRRFTRIRTRMILQKHYEISLLEKEIDQIDNDERNPLHLGCLQRDSNQARHSTFRRLNDLIEEYAIASSTNLPFGSCWQSMTRHITPTKPAVAPSPYHKKARYCEPQQLGWWSIVYRTIRVRLSRAKRPLQSRRTWRFYLGMDGKHFHGSPGLVSQ